jgi:cyclic AMP-responsive element-binding protein 3
MDLYCSDKKLSELGGGTLALGDLLDNDVFTPPASGPVTMDHFAMESSSMDPDWLDTIFDDPVLNDRMISDALQSEHSYSSLANSDEQTLDLSKATGDKDVDMDLTAINPNSLSSAPLTSSAAATSLLSVAAASAGLTAASTAGAGATPYQLTHTPLPEGIKHEIKQEPLDLSLDTEMTTVTVARSTTHPAGQTSLLKQQQQPTIILQQQTQQYHTATIKQERLVLPKVNIKVEPQHNYITTSSLSPDHYSESYDGLSLPPTPPSSTNSDSDCGAASPPGSPLRASLRHRPVSPHLQQPFFMSPIPTSGVLVLTEEEKRTLISEGYPIPAKLPLTKQEEKNLKKIRRKIKNKISAQESRRKKKEYLETLERKVEAYSQENGDLRKKVDTLQSSNQSLLSQLQKLQAAVRSLRPGSPGGSATGTCLMVLVMCFAVFLGSWSPTSLSIGHYGSVSPLPLPVVGPMPYPGAEAAGGDAGGSLPNGLGGAGGGGNLPQGPALKDPSNDYSTPNMRSRMLLSHDDLEDSGTEWGPAAPYNSYKAILGSWFYGCLASEQPAGAAAPTVEASTAPLLPLVSILDKETEINQTKDGGLRMPGNVAPSSGQNEKQQQQESMHPDIMVTAATTSTKRVNTTA